jgi:hypothetical protein
MMPTAYIYDEVRRCGWWPTSRIMCIDGAPHLPDFGRCGSSHRVATCSNFGVLPLRRSAVHRDSISTGPISAVA